MNLFKNKKIITVLAIMACLSAAIMNLQADLIKVSAKIIPVAVSASHIGFGTVFPGEQLKKNFTVSCAEEGEGVNYKIIQKRKPLPPEHPEYPDGGDPEMPGYYRDLCPYLIKAGEEGEGDVEGDEGGAFVGPEDASDAWTIYFEVPAIFGHIAQDHTGGIIDAEGEYGCDISIDVEEEGECEQGEERRCGQTDAGECGYGTQICDENGSWGECAGAVYPAAENCGDGLDNDCDGNTDCADNDCACGGGGFIPASVGNAGPAPIILGEEGAPNLTIDKETDMYFANPGDIIAYKIHITNNGNLTAYNATLTDTLPAGFTFSGSGDTAKTWPLGDIEPGQTKNIEYNVAVSGSAAAGIYANLARAAADNHGPITDSTDLEVRKVEILGIELAPTGFSAKEFMVLILIFAIAACSAILLRKKYLTR